MNEFASVCFVLYFYLLILYLNIHLTCTLKSGEPRNLVYLEIWTTSGSKSKR